MQFTTRCGKLGLFLIDGGWGVPGVRDVQATIFQLIPITYCFANVVVLIGFLVVWPYAMPVGRSNVFAPGGLSFVQFRSCLAIRGDDMWLQRDPHLSGMFTSRKIHFRPDKWFVVVIGEFRRRSFLLWSKQLRDGGATCFTNSSKAFRLAIQPAP